MTIHETEKVGGSGACKISVVVALFNTEKYLRRCVDSVLSQTFTDFELILVDDCSTDGSPAICDEYAQKDARVKVIHNGQNQGSSKARKTGLGEAAGGYVLFVDSDDWIESSMLETMYKKVVDDELDMAYCGFYQNTETEQQEYDIPYSINKIELIKELLAEKFCSAIWYKLADIKIYKKIIFPTSNIGEDMQISVQMLHYSKKIGYAKVALYHYYIYSDSLSNDDKKKLQKYADHYEILAWITKFLYDNYKSEFSIFEPELSNRINLLKLHFAMEKPIRKFSVFHELYPESNRHIFSPAWRMSFINKVILFLSVHNRMFLADIFIAARHAVRAVYRLIIPKNVRNAVWRRRKLDTAP
jgi:glycosyltransferase involved in cell wall biosynthesis